MVEIEQEELERLRAIEEQHNTLLAEHEQLKQSNSTLKDDYIALCKGQQQKAVNKTDDFDVLCKEKFGK